ncbi:MAG: hypothetical protein KF764_29520 [Labilithrix sp.]|nr:hypothetical protein [Labilithrix sp.]
MFVIASPFLHLNLGDACDRRFRKHPRAPRTPRCERRETPQCGAGQLPTLLGPERIEADEERAVLGELLDAVERVVDCIETGDHRALAVRVLDAKVLKVEKLSPARLVAGSPIRA